MCHRHPVANFGVLGDPLIRLITCLRRRSEMTSEEFIAEWEDPKTKMLFDRAVEALQPAKFVRNRTLVVKFNQDLMEMRNSEAPFDAVVEWWWQGTQALNPKMETPEAKEALKNLFLHQKTSS